MNEATRKVEGILWDHYGGTWEQAREVAEKVIETLQKENIPDGRNPKQCPKCRNWCLYDGWDHTHANGIGIGSCKAGGSSDG